LRIILYGLGRSSYGLGAGLGKYLFCEYSCIDTISGKTLVKYLNLTVSQVEKNIVKILPDSFAIIYDARSARLHECSILLEPLLHLKVAYLAWIHCNGHGRRRK
jgi:hypothetical protein